VHTMETYGGMDISFCSFLASALDRGELSASCLVNFIPSTHGIGVWLVSSTASLDVLEERNPFSLPGMGHGSFGGLAHDLVTVPTVWSQ
jgi:hypothetical protein